MTFRELGWIVAEAAKTARKILVRQLTMLEINNSAYNMKKEEPKRDKKCRFVKKTDEPKVGVDCGMKEDACVSEMRITLPYDDYKQLKLERDAFKILTEKYMSKYLNKCYALRQEQAEHLSCLDTLGEAYKQIGWYTSKISWWKRWLLRNEMREMDKNLYRMFVRENRLEQE